MIVCVLENIPISYYVISYVIIPHTWTPKNNSLRPNFTLISYKRHHITSLQWSSVNNSAIKKLYHIIYHIINGFIELLHLVPYMFLIAE